MNPVCPVCEQQPLSDFQTINETVYRRCDTCFATVMASEHRLSASGEREVYDLHNNGECDPGYRRFLSKLSEPLLDRMPFPDREHLRGLDFGCGPGPALAQMLTESGVDMALYDPNYYPDKTVLERQYDLVTCTEVVEHLHHPAAVFRQLNDLLCPGGWLGVMTCFQTSDDKFAGWHYRRDPTHVVFYREATMEWLAGRFGWLLEIPAKDVALFRRP